MLAKQLQEFDSVQGEVSYDTLAPEQIEKHYRGNVQYCPEDDVHFPTCTSRRALPDAHGVSGVSCVL